MKKKVLGLLLSIGMIFSGGQNVMAAEENASSTASVDSLEELSDALANEQVDHIIITDSFDVPCDTANNSNGTSALIVSRNMKIEGSGSGITLKRTVAEGANNGSLQSMFGICGNGEYDGVEVSLYNITLDGGAVWGNYKGMDRVHNQSSIIKQGSSAGRSLVDVYYKGTLNLEEGLTIQNSYTTYSLSSLSGDSGSYNFGGAVRVDFDTRTGGGTVNVKAGSTIKDTAVAGNRYGGALGAYSYARLNVYGGLIENCAASYGGAIGCTNRASHSADVAGTFNMYGGTIRNCVADKGGAIHADGSKKCVSSLLGGNIIDCEAIYGGAVSLCRGGSTSPTFNIAPYKEDGPLKITGCSSKNGSLSPDTEFDGIRLGYEGLYFEGDQNVEVATETVTVNFKKQLNDETNFASLTIKKGAHFGESFPGNPTSDENVFLDWNTKADGTGTTFTRDTVVEEDTTIYARWLLAPEITESEDVSAVYGDRDKTVSVTAKTAYGGDFVYTWYTCDADGSNRKVIDGENKNEYKLPKLNAGTYYYICEVSNIAGEFSASNISKVIKVDIKSKKVGIDWTDNQFKYDGQDKLPQAMFKEDVGIIDGDDCQLVVSGAQKEVGKYEAVAELSGNDSSNYSLAEGDERFAFEIVNDQEAKNLEDKKENEADKKPEQSKEDKTTEEQKTEEQKTEEQKTTEQQKDDNKSDEKITVEYETSETLKPAQLKPNLKVVDKKTGGKYKITKIVKKKGKVVGGTVTYMQPYNKNCKVATISNNVRLAGVVFKVTELNDNAFKNCKKITKVTIGSNINKIGSNSFSGCKNLKSVSIRTNCLKKIGNNAFKGINKKATIKVPKKSYKKYKKLINKKTGFKKTMKLK